MRGMMGSLNTMTPNAGYLYGLVIGSYVPVHIIPWVIVGQGNQFFLGGVGEISCFNHLISLNFVCRI